MANRTGSGEEAMARPFFSVIIANYNHGKFLETAIRSVLNQTCRDCELIVVDGGSADGSADTIRRFQDQLAWWVSEPDGGQSAAFNKGFCHASGKYGCWLNADDVMLPKALQCVRHFIEQHPDAQWIGGGTVFLDADLRVLWCSRPSRVISRLHRFLPGASVNGPSAFFASELLARVGTFDETRHYAMDIDLWRRMFADNARLHHVKDYLWGFRVHSGSKTSHRFLTGQSDESFRQEGIGINAKYGSTPRMLRLGEKYMRATKLLNGTYLRSFMDTRRYKGRLVFDIWPGNFP